MFTRSRCSFATRTERLTGNHFTYHITGLIGAVRWGSDGNACSVVRESHVGAQLGIGILSKDFEFGFFPFGAIDEIEDLDAPGAL